MNPLKDTPRNVTESLLRWGGKNPYGDPNWRIILAQNHLVQRAGMWTEFDDDPEMVQFETVGNQVRYNTRQIAPDAIRCGVFWVPLYEVKGWILERWFPPEVYGDRQQWESALSQDNETPMMGPFPEHGGYFMLTGGGPWGEVPPLEQVRAAIAQWENGDHLHGRVDAEALELAMRDDFQLQQDREQRKYDEFVKEVAYQRMSHLEFIKGNPALAGFRNRIVTQRGITSHV